MEDQNYTIKDIARMAGVSAGTVDRVLHNRGDVSPKSKAKVQKVLMRFIISPMCLLSVWLLKEIFFPLFDTLLYRA